MHRNRLTYKMSVNGLRTKKCLLSALRNAACDESINLTGGGLLQTSGLNHDCGAGILFDKQRRIWLPMAVVNVTENRWCMDSGVGRVDGRQKWKIIGDGSAKPERPIEAEVGFLGTG